MNCIIKKLKCQENYIFAKNKEAPAINHFLLFCHSVRGSSGLGFFDFFLDFGKT